LSSLSLSQYGLRQFTSQATTEQDSTVQNRTGQERTRQGRVRVRVEVRVRLKRVLERFADIKTSQIKLSKGTSIFLAHQSSQFFLLCNG
jgi:hypothetical protein